MTIDERLDRISELLNWTTQGLTETKAIADSNVRAIEANSNAMAEMRAGLAETKAIADSNIRAIEANSNAMTEYRQEQVEMRREFNHMIGIIAQQQSEIAGLRTETNRMLDILINQRQNEDEAS